MVSARCCYVYVIQGDRECKIGVAIDVNKRFAVLRREGARRIVKTWHVPDHAIGVEQAAHRVLTGGKAKPSGPRSEWFRVSAKRAVAAVEASLDAKHAPRKDHYTKQIEAYWARVNNDAN